MFSDLNFNLNIFFFFLRKWQALVLFDWKAGIAEESLNKNTSKSIFFAQLYCLQITIDITDFFRDLLDGS